MPEKRTYACVACRSACRRNWHGETKPRCPGCKEDMRRVFSGKIPKKTDGRGWGRLDVSY